MQDEAVTLTQSERGGVAVSSGAIAQIVRSAALESYGVVGLAGGGRLARLLARRGRPEAIEVRMGEDGLAVVLHVVVEHGLKLAEVATAVRSRIEYELDRMLGLPIAQLDVHIERVRSR